MTVHMLSWPGLPDIPFYIIDPKSNRLYGAEKPVPSERSDLDVFENRYVKLSRILELFTPNMIPEAHFILENLQKNFNLRPIVRITEKHRKTTSYLPVEVLLVLIIVWPLCMSFQSTKRTLLNYLDRYPESVCVNCGYVNRDCRCDSLKTNPKNTFVGFATTSTEKGVQTDPVMSGMNVPASISSGMQANNQGISVLIPSGVKLPAGVKIPIAPAGGQMPPLYYPNASGSLGMNMFDANSNPFGFLKPPMAAQQTPQMILPQPRSHKRGRPPVSPFPYIYQSNIGYQPNLALFGPFGGDGSPSSMPTPPLLQMPGFQGLLGPDFSLPGCLPTTVGCNFNYIQPMASSGVNSIPAVTQTISSSMLSSGTKPGDATHPLVGRKRKYSDSDLKSGERSALMRTIAVQTSTKSFIKKCKLKEEKLAERSDGSARPGAAAAAETPENYDSNLLDSENQSESSQLTSKQSAAENLGNSPGKIFQYADFIRKDERDGGTKKFGGNLWRQLDDSSDDDKQQPVSGISGSIGSGNDGGDVQKQGGNADGMNVSAMDVSERNLNQKDNVLPENAAVESKETENGGENKDKDGCTLVQKEPLPLAKAETESGAIQKTGAVESDFNREVSINRVAGSEDLVPGTSGKSHGMGLMPLTTGELNDFDACEDMRTLARVAVEFEAQLKSLPVIENENEVFKVLPDEMTPDRKSGDAQDPTRTVSLAHSSGETKPDCSAIEALPSTELSHPTTDGVSPQTPVRKIYGKFEYVPTREHIFRCLIPKCSQSFDTRLAAEMHNLVHPEGGENANHLKCPKCEFTAPFYHWFDLVRHVRQSHQMMMSREPFSCKLCGLVFEDEESLTSHIDFHYSNRYKCIHCGLLLLTWGQVKRHLESCVDKHKGNLNLGCPYCTFVFHKKNIRNLHLLSHSDVGLACALCQDNAAWADWKTLRKHYQNRHTKTLQGKIAPFRHKLPTKRKPPRCKRCDIEFKSHDLYVAHMTRTHDLVPYTLVECATCGHRFRTERSHEWHVRHVHVEEITCEKCDFVATSKSVMKAHVAQKHSDKQHTCSECEKSFAFYHQLKVHMAHHARHTIYPCQKCDQEFTRQNDLRQHLVNDHDDPSDRAPHSCPECDYRCYSRANLNAHIKKLHPELLEDDSIAAGAVADEEDDGVDHCYSTKKADAQPSIDLLKVRRFGRKKGRQRKSIKYEWDRMKTTDSYSSIEDRRERRRMNRMMKEADDRMKKLKKLTCARTRSYHEHQAIKSGAKGLNAVGRESQAHDRHLHQSRAARAAGADDSGGDFGGVETIGSGLYGVQPYLDHGYCKFDGNGTWIVGERFKMVVPNSGQGESLIDAPDVSAFQECETQLLGLAGAPPIRRRGRPPNSTLNRTVVDARRKFTSVLESVSSGVMQSSNFQTIRLTPRVAAVSTTSAIDAQVAADDDGLENLGTEIPDFELIADSDLLKNLSSYNIIDELFSMTQASGANISTLDHAAKKVHLGDLPIAFQSPRESGETAESLANTFSDGLVMDGEAQLSADFDDIELGEDVYSLFLGGGNNSAQSSSGAPLENGGDELTKGGGNISASQADVLSLTSLPASISISPRGLLSPRRIGNSLVPRSLSSLQNLNRNSSLGAQPFSLCSVSADAEVLPLPNDAERNTARSGADPEYPPQGGSINLSQSCEENGTGNGLLLVKKAFEDTIPDSVDRLSFADKAPGNLPCIPRSSEVLQVSSGLFEVAPEFAGVAPIQPNLEACPQLTESAADCKDLPDRRAQESVDVAEVCRSASPDLASKEDNGSTVNVD